MIKLMLFTENNYVNALTFFTQKSWRTKKYTVSLIKRIYQRIFQKKHAHLGHILRKKHPDLRHTPWHYPTESGKSVTIHQLTSSRPTGTIRAPVCSKTGLRRPRERTSVTPQIQAAWSDLKRENGTVFKIFGVIWGWTQVSNKDLLL